MNKPYILTVDDEPINQMAIQVFLENDFEVETASNGAECIDSVAIRKPDIILMDIEMPLVSGIDACVQLKANQDYKQILIIFISTLSSEKVIKKCFDAGGDAYFKKPVNKEGLIKKINELLTDSDRI